MLPLLLLAVLRLRGAGAAAAAPRLASGRAVASAGAGARAALAVAPGGARLAGGGRVRALSGLLRRFLSRLLRGLLCGVFLSHGHVALAVTLVIVGFESSFIGLSSQVGRETRRVTGLGLGLGRSLVALPGGLLLVRLRLWRVRHVRRLSAAGLSAGPRFRRVLLTLLARVLVGGLCLLTWAPSVVSGFVVLYLFCC